MNKIMFLLFSVAILGSGCEETNYADDNGSYHSGPLLVSVVGNNWSSRLAGLGVGQAEPFTFYPYETARLDFDLYDGETVDIWAYLFDANYNTIRAESFEIGNWSREFHVNFYDDEIRIADD